MSTPELPPQVQIQQLMSGFWKTRALQAAVRLGVADRLANGPRTAAEIAADLNANADGIGRLLRALVTIGICVDSGGGRYALTPVGDTLRTDAPDSMRAMVLHFGEMMWETWSHLADSVRTGQTARKIMGMGESFDFISSNPEAAAVFNTAMAQITRGIAAAVVQAYDFAGIGKLMDVGGGYGQLLAAILGAHPNMRGILFDMEHAADGARREIAAAGIAGRCDIVVGDFFKEVPAGADAYILKSIIHDWDDERAIAILRNCRRAAGKTAKVILVEMVVPDRMRTTPEDQRIAMLDLNMMVGPGGRERTEDEYRRLFEAAGLKLVRVVPTRSPSSVIEATPA